MNSIVLYYSYSGYTKKVAQKLAHTQGATLVEIQTRKRKNIVTTFLVDCPRAMMRKRVPIQPVTQDLSGYDLITLAAPVWAGKPAPAFNAMVDLLPKGKNVQVILTSGGGDTKKSEEGTRRLIKQKGCKVLAYKDVKQS
jgi:flavodoxin